MSAAHYPYLLDPTVYPDYGRRHVRVPTWETFGNATQMLTLRGFEQEDGKLVNVDRDLDDYTERFGLGRIVWPHFPTVFAENFRELVDEIKQRGLYLFDIWGHVPGSGMEGPWAHTVPPDGMVEYLERELDDRFLGFDNGEQDGRYVGGYAQQQCPAASDRFRQYLNFQRHFQRMCDDLGNHMSTLVSLCFGHYFLKEGNHVLIGAETAQALPNSQVYYAFIRGAGKQHGIPWFGNASVFNRWGFKQYTEGQSEGYEFGPTKGTSLSLLKRLIYTHYLYNCVAVGFESGWFIEEEGERTLTPIGEIQAGAGRLMAEHGQPGTMHAPVALMLDHFAGWAMPRHLYTEKVYQVWGAMPYDPGDYLTHGALSMLYPGYEDASYFRDERGFLSSTPYGDMSDCVLSDAPPWVLEQYGLLVLAGDVCHEEGHGVPELADNLARFVDGGGHVVLTAANVAVLGGTVKLGPCTRFDAGTSVTLADGREVVEPRAFDLHGVESSDGFDVIAQCGEAPAAIRAQRATGTVTLLLSPFGLNADPLVSGPIANEEETPLACPFVLLEHVRQILGDAFADQQIFSVGDGLSLITCRKGLGSYTLGVHNNDAAPHELRIVSRCGKIADVTEIELDRSEQGAVGQRPEGVLAERGVSHANAIAGGDIRLFDVTIRETGVRVLPGAQPPKRPRNRMIAVPGIGDLKAAILARPTFYQHFDGVKIDWTYLRVRDAAQLERERGWLKRQGVRIVVDFSPGLNFYPDLTLLDTLDFRYDESVAAIDDALDKMQTFGVRRAIVSLHRKPENQCDEARADDRFLAGVQSLCRRAGERGIELLLQHHPAKWHGNVADTLRFIEDVGADNLRFALSTAHVALGGELGESAWPEFVASRMGRSSLDIGALLISAPATDVLGQSYDAHAPLVGSGLDTKGIAEVVRDLAGRGVPIILDADYPDWAAAYRDARAVWPAVAPEASDSGRERT